MGLKEWLIPQEKKFFDMLELQSKNVLKGALALKDMLEHYENTDEKRRIIKRIETDGDTFVHNLFEELNKTFITPIDREDITALTSALDDILDYIEAVAERLVLYKISTPTPHLIKFGALLCKSTDKVHAAILKTKNLKDRKTINGLCEEINSLENEGDNLLRTATAELFETKNPIEIIKLKELYDNLETAIDCCEDVADVIGNILVKYG